MTRDFGTRDTGLRELTRQETWEKFLVYRLMKGRFNWHEFNEADSFVEKEDYLPLAQKIAAGEGIGLPTKKLVNKMGSGKKRVVYSFAPDEMMLLKLIAFLLYRYDDRFAPNCYAFRRGLKAYDAVFNLRKAVSNKKMWAYKLDIHDYFNSIDVDLLLPMLKEMLDDDEPLYRFFEKLLKEQRVISNGQIIEEPHGVMAGTPTAPFLADVFLKEVDRYYYNIGVTYARYSDDIILFAPDYETLMQYKDQMANFLAQYHLEVNPEKEHIYSPDDAYEFLGFKCKGHQIDISEATKKKMKGKISRQARALLRWSHRHHLEPEKAMVVLIKYFNRKFFESDDPETLTWSRWFFPVINQTEGLMDIDHYLQQNIRFLSTGKHNKSNYRVKYRKLKELGYKSLVNEYYKFRDSAPSTAG